LVFTRILFFDLLIWLAGAGLIAFIVYRLALVAPLRRLSQAAWRIGRGDLRSPLVGVGGGAEVGRLASSFEEMRQRLLEASGEARRRAAEAEALLAGMVEGVFAVDRERRLRYLNPQAAGLLGIPADEALGRFCGDVLQPRLPGGERPCDFSCPIVHARSRGDSRATEHLLAPGGPRTVVLRSAALTAERQVVLIREESDLEAGRRVRDSVFAHVSHELKTPLAGQLASIELLLDQLEGHGIAGDARQLTESLQRSTLRLERLIDNLLESVRLEKSPFDLPREPLDLYAVVDEAIEAVAPLLAQKEQPLHRRLPATLPPFYGEPDSLAQVFVNLLANANKFAPPGTAIEIGGREVEGGVELWVEDRGPGLPPAAAGSIFDLFHRGPAPAASRHGLGLGLFIVKTIVERHGGRVYAEAAEPQGARFRLRLPLAAAPAAAGAGEVV
jgi:signal transduction histidine kinase/HAMP domain-containing protein